MCNITFYTHWKPEYKCKYMGSDFLVMISSVDGFYIMDTEPVSDNCPCLLYKIFVHKTLCRMKMPVQDSVWHLPWSRLPFRMPVLQSMRLMNNNCIRVQGTAKCLGNLRSRALFGNLALKLQLMSNNGCICGNE